MVGTSTASHKTRFASSPLSHWGAQLRPLAGGDLVMDSDQVDEGGRLFSIFFDARTVDLVDGNVTVVHTQVQRDYDVVQKEKLMESQAKPFQQVWSFLEKVCSNEFFVVNLVF